jgi:hypothetical protein
MFLCSDTPNHALEMSLIKVHIKYLFTHSMDHSLASEANRRSFGQNRHAFYEIRTFITMLTKAQALVTMLSQINPVHTLTSYVSSILILPSRLC